ncbi:MAG: preprotein translocase subunit SecG [Pseudomonadota bacterium]
MDTLLTIVHVIVCLFLVGIVLLQHGKGADIGASFGGSSQSLFGTEGPLPLLNKITTASAIIFMLTSVSLAYISSRTGSTSVMSTVAVSQPAQVQVEKPVVKDEAVKDTPAESNSETEANTEKQTN